MSEKSKALVSMRWIGDGDRWWVDFRMRESGGGRRHTVRREAGKEHRVILGKKVLGDMSDGRCMICDGDVNIL